MKSAAPTIHENIPGGRYEFVERLGAGAFGAVYKARDTFLERLVAVKSIRLDTSVDPEQREALNKRFVREAQVSAQLQHPNIVTIHDIVFTPHTGFIVMEFIEGSTLQSLLSQKRVPLARAIDIVCQIGRALDYAHEHKVIHRDVKPGNIMITPSFDARITDFGIAKSDGATHLTMSGTLVGTPDYMSPEQATGESVDARADLFSLGCVLYECLTGEKPFRGPGLTAVLLSIVNTDPLQSSTWTSLALPEDVGAVLERALQKAPADRFQRAREFVAALQDVSLDAFPDEAFIEEPAGAALGATQSFDTERDEPRVGSDTLTRLRSEERPLRFTNSVSDELQMISLTPAQGFILSRIDGFSRAGDILSVSPMPESDVASTLVDLIDRGLLTWADSDTDQAPTPPKSEAASAPPESALSHKVRVEVDRILRLGKQRRYSELLGIDISTPTAEVKKAYLELVQRFHPDAQQGDITAADRQKLTQACAVATDALMKVSPRRASQPEPPPATPEPAPSDTARLRQKDFAGQLFARARAAYDAVDYWGAIQLARQAIELDGDNAAYYHLLGLGLTKNQNWAREAQEMLEKAAELDDANAEYLEDLAELYRTLGLSSRADALSERARSASNG